MNHQEVAEEDRRKKLPANWEAMQRRVEWENKEEEAKKVDELYWQSWMIDLIGVMVLCPWARCFTLLLPLSIQLYKFCIRTNWLIRGISSTPPWIGF